MLAWFQTQGSKRFCGSCQCRKATSGSRLAVWSQHYKEAVCVLPQICSFLFKTLLCSGLCRWGSVVKAAAHGFGLHGTAVTV